MSTSASAKYLLYSTVQGNPSVGVWCNSPRSSQFVVLGANCNTWYATPPVTVRGPYKLAVKPYAFTAEVNGEVLASNNPNESQEWTILPIQGRDGFYYISSDTVGNMLWTAGGMYQPITLEPFTGEPEQVFKLVKQ